MGQTRLGQRLFVQALGVLVAGLLALMLAGCGSSNNANKKNANASASGATPAAQITPAPVARTFSKAPSIIIDPNKGYIATIKTDKGDIVVQLNAKAAPLTVNNFVFLAQQHFYDGLTCHRVIPDFVAQCGDPKGDGSGGPGYSIPDEASPLTHVEGAIAMAKAGPNTAGSQFYITLAPQHTLDGQYTVFGQVISGLDVAKQLTPRDPTNPATANATPSRIISITIQTTDVTPTPVPAASVQPPAPAVVPAGTPGR